MNAARISVSLVDQLLSAVQQMATRRATDLLGGSAATDATQPASDSDTHIPGRGPRSTGCASLHDGAAVRALRGGVGLANGE